MTDLTTAADLGTAAGTLVLAIATFASIRAGQKASRIAERSLLAGLRPVLFPTRFESPEEKVGFGDSRHLRVPGGEAVIEVTDAAIYMACSVRNVGSGMAVLDRWCVMSGSGMDRPDPAPVEDFRRLTRDLYIPPNDQSFWQGAIRDPDDPLFRQVAEAVEAADDRMTLEILYGDLEGGQRTISRFALTPLDGRWLVSLSRHWSLDRENPR